MSKAEHEPVHDRHDAGDQLERLHARVAELEATISAISSGHIDALVVRDDAGEERLFTLRGTDTPYQLLVEQMFEGALTIDAAGTILYANRRFADMLGMPLERVIGARLSIFADMADDAALRAACEAAPSAEEAQRLEVGFRHAAGHVLPTYVSINALSESDQVCVVITDVTEKKEAEERKQLLHAERVARSEAERVSQLKDEFVATLSHELRTPLNAIVGWSQILAGGPRTEEELRLGLKTIERNARVQVQMIEDLLDISRITSGKLRLDVQRIGFCALIEAAIESASPAAENKQIRIERTLDYRADCVSGDPNRLQQVVWNLLSNALKFTSQGGRIELVLTRKGSAAELSISDTGVGIPHEFLPHVFDRFRQADGSTTRQFGGLGLGLAIVKQVVELHGGTVHAQSGGKGLGATFVVSLPLLEERRSTTAPAASRSAGAQPDAGQLAGVKVLYIDDDADTAELVRRWLSEHGAMVLVGTSAAEGRALLLEERPHVLMADIGMPDEDGYTFIRSVRALSDESASKTPAVAVTALARPEDRQRALLAGFQSHVAKPVEPSELVAVVASLAGRTDRQRIRS